MIKKNLSNFKKEYTYYNKMKIPESTKEVKADLKKILNRQMETMINDTDEYISRIFILNSYQGYKLVGYKILMNYFSSEGTETPSLDSRITADMILGIWIDQDIKKNVRYYPLTNAEKKYIFNLIKVIGNIELYYPFVMQINSNLMPIWKDVWDSVNEGKSEYESIKFLSETEPHFRKYTNDIVKRYKLDNSKIYDPACSTGEFLYSIKKSFPNCYVIGHDIDPVMINIGKDYLDEYLCCDASLSPIKNESIDLLILRFLNYYVVSLKEAINLFEILFEKVKFNGYIICFGHSPVLINNDILTSKKIELIQSIGYEETSDSIFQYYLIKKIESSIGQ